MTLQDHDLSALTRAEHADPFSVLGMHSRPDGLAMHALLPGAAQVELVDKASGQVHATLQRLAGGVVFGAVLAE